MFLRGRFFIVFVVVVDDVIQPPLWQGHGSDGLGNTTFGPATHKPQKGHAATAIIDLVNKYPNEVHIIALGSNSKLLKKWYNENQYSIGLFYGLFCI
jgi:hypothetical protein